MTAAPPLALPAGFFLLPISLTGDAPCQPHLYVKVHRDDDDGESGEEASNHRRRKTGGGGNSGGGGGSLSMPAPHAVFVVGLPLLWRPLAPVLESLFGAYGEVEAVAVHPDQVRVFFFHRLVFFLLMPKKTPPPLTPPPFDLLHSLLSSKPQPVLRHRLVLLAKGAADPGERGSRALGRDAAPAPSLLDGDEKGGQEEEENIKRRRRRNDKRAAARAQAVGRVPQEALPPRERRARRQARPVGRRL